MAGDLRFVFLRSDYNRRLKLPGWGGAGENSGSAKNEQATNYQSKDFSHNRLLYTSPWDGKWN
jgi:hypothetical protein